MQMHSKKKKEKKSQSLKLLSQFHTASLKGMNNNNLKFLWTHLDSYALAQQAEVRGSLTLLCAEKEFKFKLAAHCKQKGWSGEPVVT